MPGKRDVHGMRYKREEDMPSKINPAFIVVSTTLFIVGVAMLIIVDKLGDECKMEAFDKSSYYDSAKMGNLPKWFNYTGTLFVFTGLWAVMATGLIPLFCRYKCRRCGGNIWAKLMESFCSYLILTYGVLITIICNIIGSFWIYAAKLSRTATNSYESGDVNYCHPIVWNMANIVTNAFWVLLILGAISGISRVHHSLRGHLSPFGKKEESERETKITDSLN